MDNDLIRVRIWYLDGSSRDITCRGYGAALDNDRFMMFTDGNTNMDWPKWLINVDTIREIEKLEENG